MRPHRYNRLAKRLQRRLPLEVTSNVSGTVQIAYEAMKLLKTLFSPLFAMPLPAHFGPTNRPTDQPNSSREVTNMTTSYCSGLRLTHSPLHLARVHRETGGDGKRSLMGPASPAICRRLDEGLRGVATGQPGLRWREAKHAGDEAISWGHIDPPLSPVSGQLQTLRSSWGRRLTLREAPGVVL